MESFFHVEKVQKRRGEEKGFRCVKHLLHIHRGASIGKSEVDTAGIAIFHDLLFFPKLSPLVVKYGSSGRERGPLYEANSSWQVLQRFKCHSKNTVCLC